MNTPDRIECRHKPVYYALPLLIVAFVTAADLAVVSNPLNPPGRAPIFIIVAEAAIFAVCVLHFLLILRLRVVADKTGLTWRGLWAEKHASWSQVRDYYELRRESHLVVETEAGNLKISPMVTTHLPELCLFIQQHALSARARDWRFKESYLEPGDRRVFCYSFNQAGLFPLHLIIALGAGPFIVSAGPGNSFINPFTRYPGPPGSPWWFSLLPVLRISVPIVIFFLPRLWYSWHADKILLRRKEEIIEVDANGLRWSKGSETRTLQWAEITELQYLPAPRFLRHLGSWTVHSHTGSFTFVPHLMTNGSLLVDLIQSHIRTPASPLAPPFQDSNSCHNEP